MSANGRYDVVVLGGGVNGLVAASILAAKGRRVALVERGEALGGLAAPREFHAGYRSGGVLHDTATLRHEMLWPLNLAAHGLQLDSSPRPTFVPDGKGSGLTLHFDPVRAAPEIARYSQRDAEQYKSFRGFVDRVKPLVNTLLDDAPPDLVFASLQEELRRSASKALVARRLGKRDMIELTRLVTLPVADWLDEWFESDLVKVALVAPALHGTFMGPRSPQSAFNLLVYESRRGAAVAGGAPELIAALEKAARARGVDIMTGAGARMIDVVDGAVAGVQLEGGVELATNTVASSCHPVRTLLDMVPVGCLTETAEQRLVQYRSRGNAAVVDVALRCRNSEFNTALGIEGAGEQPHIRLGARNLDDIERAFDAIKYNDFAASPLLDVSALSRGHAPSGHLTLSILVHFVPYEIGGGWTDARRESLAETVRTVLAEAAPVVRDAIVAMSVAAPVDIEREYGLPGGHIFHGEHGLDQLLVRPTPECSGYRTPVRGLYLCGSGSHPGGGITGAPGALAAKTILG